MDKIGEVSSGENPKIMLKLKTKKESLQISKDLFSQVNNLMMEEH